VSVKKIREIVKQKLEKKEPQTKSQNSSSVLTSLQALKNKLSTLGQNASSNILNLPQSEKWELMAACQDLSEELANLALLLSDRKRLDSYEFQAQEHLKTLAEFNQKQHIITSNLSEENIV
jgi:hypothetical protein